MVKSNYQEIDTPALIIDKDIMENNIVYMQEKVNSWGINLCPHTKTHKSLSSLDFK
ncbi:D-serine deaminase-like pyridoxal phosphate-dependent protein [Neobacillus niacini]|nr:D-serine deaminase-like pyridoxal phosphate-dependent protein [Neobacillus niacini]